MMEIKNGGAFWALMDFLMMFIGFDKLLTNFNTLNICAFQSNVPAFDHS